MRTFILVVFSVNLFITYSYAGPLDDMSSNSNYKHFEASKRAAAACLSEIEYKLVGHDIYVYGPCIKRDKTLNSFKIIKNGYELYFEIHRDNKKTIKVLCNTDRSAKNVKITDSFKGITDVLSEAFNSGEDSPGVGGRCFGTYIE